MFLFICLGGFHSNIFHDDAQIYSISANTFTMLPSRIPYKAYSFCAVNRNTDQKVYISGGKTYNSFDRRIVAFDIESSTFNTLPGRSVTEP